MLTYDFPLHNDNNQVLISKLSFKIGRTLVKSYDFKTDYDDKLKRK